MGIRRAILPFREPFPAREQLCDVRIRVPALLSLRFISDPASEPSCPYVADVRACVPSRGSRALVRQPPAARLVSPVPQSHPRTAAGRVDDARSWQGVQSVAACRFRSGFCITASRMLSYSVKRACCA